MVVVLSTPLVAMLKKTALEIPGVYEIKTNRQNCFLYCDNDKTSEENVAMIKNYIKEKKGTGFVYKVYGIFNGKVDLTADSKTPEVKMKDSYFTSGKKDITDEEIEAFKKKNNL